MDYVEKGVPSRIDKLDVIIYTGSHKITGTVHIKPAARLVDYFNSKASDRFIVVTNANVYSLPEEKLFGSAQFLVINKDAVTMVFPEAAGVPSKSDVPRSDIS